MLLVSCLGLCLVLDLMTISDLVTFVCVAICG